MSHVTAIAVEIKDLDALDAACAELKCNLRRGQTSYKWFGMSVGDYPLPAGFTEDMLGKCEHVINLPGCEYEIGVARNPNNPKTYTLLFDFWGPGQRLQSHFGNGLQKLVQLYGVHKISSDLKRRGIPFVRKQAGANITIQAAVK